MKEPEPISQRTPNRNPKRFLNDSPKRQRRDKAPAGRHQKSFDRTLTHMLSAVFGVLSSVINIRKIPCIPWFFLSLVPLWQTLKMQNKPKFKIIQNSVSCLFLWTKDDRLRTALQKNKPKQTQRTAIQSHCHSERMRGIYFNSYPDLSGFHIFDICSLIFDMLFMTNKPNFKNGKMIASHFLNMTSAVCLRPFASKNEPKQTQSVQAKNPFHPLNFLLRLPRKPGCDVDKPP